MNFTEYEKKVAIYSCYLILSEIGNGGYTVRLTELYNRYCTMLNIFGLSHDDIISSYDDAASLIDYVNKYVLEVVYL